MTYRISIVVCWLSACAALMAQDVAELEEQAMKSAVARVQPSVVRIESFGGLQSVGNVLVGTGPTTGLVVSADGYIVSSAYNFVQKPTSILVTLPTGKRVAARLVARDRSRMIVLLKVDADGPLQTPTAVARGEMIVGQWAIAVGKTLDAASPSISAGILSATDRIWGKAIQTDAKVSPSNYGGPLVDIRGRVFGVLVPLSPQGSTEVAGAEWYDSGIGFAIPLEDILSRLDRLKEGEDLLPGLMGVSLKGSDIYADEVIVAACPAGGPAHKAGIRPDDKIIELDGAPILRQANLRHALGRRYAGETVRVAVLRDEKRLELDVQLVDKLKPYAHPFLGVLPMRDPGAMTVRYVYDDSPASTAGLEPGDVITKLADYEIDTQQALRSRIVAFEVGETVDLQFTRGGKSKTVSVTLGSVPDTVPDSLPAATAGNDPPADSLPPVGVVEVKIPEESSKCVAYVPKGYHPDKPCGLIVWLHPPGKFQQDQLVERWKPLCDQNNLILLAPQSSDASKWQPTDSEFILKTIDDVSGDYNVDSRRIVLHGYQGGAAMAYLTGFSQPEVIRGIAAVDAVVPARSRPPANDPARRLAFFIARAEGSPLGKRIDGEVKRLRQMKYPVTVQDLGAKARYLNADELTRMLRWLDTLDRI